MPHYSPVDDIQPNMRAPNPRIQQINFLQNNSFKFSIDKTRYENVSFLVQKVNLPGILIDAAPFQTPWRSANFVHADKVDYSDLQISFIVDEELRNFFEIHDWLLAQVNNADNVKNDYKRRDIKLTILSSHNNPIFTVTFVDAFPINLGDIQLDSTVTDSEYVSVDVTFKYSYYKLDKI